MRSQKNEDLNIQVKPQGENEVFSFAIPKGFLNQEKLQFFLEFLELYEPARVNKSMLNIYFTAINDIHFSMDEEEKLHIEAILTMLTVLSCKCE